MTKIYVPTVNASTFDYDSLFTMVEQVRNGHQNVVFDFSRCTFMQQNGIAVLGGLIRLLQHQGKNVMVATETIQQNIKRNFTRNGFLPSFGLAQQEPGTQTSIPYREDRIQSSKGIIDYLRTHWLGQGWIRMSEALSDGIISTLWEVYANAFEHSRSPVGVFTCGQFYPNLKQIKLAVVDFGEGIPNIIRKHFKHPTITADKALQWAFQRGTSTAATNFSRGIGLDLLKSLVRVNEGKLEVFSNEGYVIVDAHSEKYVARPLSFQGTIVNVTLRCDNRYYRLATEQLTGPLF